jgi:hypothetical protein
MQPLLNKMSIVLGAPRDDQVACLALTLDELATDPQYPNVALFEFRSDEAGELGFFDLAAIGLAYLERSPDRLMLVGEWGDVVILGPKGVVTQTVDMPEDRGPLRAVRIVAGRTFAVGTNVQVYEREPNGVWRDVGPDAAQAAAFPRNHLEAIDGFSPGEVYAAGRQGVIWHYDGKQWHPVETPTNLALTGICCADDGKVYACGQCGIVVVGRGDRFQVVGPDRPLADLWDIRSFKGKIYTTTTQALMVLGDDGLLPCLPAMREATTFYSLAVSDGVLWSFGAKHLLRSDGVNWVRPDTVRVYRRP